ncbi:MAG: 50S ribosomal protein L10 [Candidatus Omnitrophica bacterium]|nr:50S ribosomal protein L10 [Candidatus Omnitrophota bacterium]
MKGAAVKSSGSEAKLGRKVRTRWMHDMGKQLSTVDSVVVAQVKKVPTRELNQLRQRLESQDGSFSVVKNALCRLAFREKGWTDLEAHLQGTCGITPIRGDAVAAAKLLVQFAKDHEGFILKGGVMGGAVLTAQDLSALAKLPTRQVLLSQLAGILISPVRNLAMLLNSPIRQLAMTVAALAQKKKEAPTTTQAAAPPQSVSGTGDAPGDSKDLVTGKPEVSKPEAPPAPEAPKF